MANQTRAALLAEIESLKAEAAAAPAPAPVPETGTVIRRESAPVSAGHTLVIDGETGRYRAEGPVEPQVSGSGKNLTLASTRGGKAIGMFDGKPVTVNLNIYTPL